MTSGVTARNLRKLDDLLYLGMPSAVYLGDLTQLIMAHQEAGP